MDIKHSSFTKRDTLIVKGVGIWLMLFHHLYHGAGRYNGFSLNFFPLTEDVVLHIAELCKCCVGLFAFLTAYGITKSFSATASDYKITRDTSRPILTKRVISLCSGFFAAYVVAIVGTTVLKPDTVRTLYQADSAITSIFYALMDMLGLSVLLGTPYLIWTWWYMAVAYALVFLVPVMLLVYRKIDFWILPFCIAMAVAFKWGDNVISRWLIVFPALGVVCADHRVFERIADFQMDAVGKFLIVTAILAVTCFWAGSSDIWHADQYGILVILMDALMSFIVILWTFLYICKIPVVSNVLAFFGKHSMNMFLLHNFLRHIWTDRIIYKLKHFILIYAALLVSSLAVSVVLEWIKERLGYNAFVKKMIQKCAR